MAEIVSGIIVIPIKKIDNKDNNDMILSSD